MGLLKSNAYGLVVLTWLVDLLVPVAAFFVAYRIYPQVLPIPTLYYHALASCVLLSALYFPLVSLYRPRRGEWMLTELRNITVAVVALFTTLALIGLATRAATDLSRVWFALWFVMSLSGLVSARVALRSTLRWFRSLGFNRRHVVLIGDQSQCHFTEDALFRATWAGFHVTRVFSTTERADGLLGRWDEIRHFLQTHHVDQVWIALPLRDVDVLSTLMERLERFVVDVRFTPDERGAELMQGSLVSVAGLPMVNLSVAPIEGHNVILKELEDRILASVFLLIASPVMLMIALAIRLTSNGPVLFKQERLGWGGNPIQMYKFRTMPVGVESDTGPVWNKAEDNRATPLGAFLRRTSLDELPQLINVLRGEMSLVGPRPERPIFVEKFKHEVPGYMQKHRVKAGITGWAQINGWRGNTDLNQRIEHDLYYIRNWSLLFDLKIILLTVFRGFVNKNAY